MAAFPATPLGRVDGQPFDGWERADRWIVPRRSPVAYSLLEWLQRCDPQTASGQESEADR